jgi:hypothetical protein
MSTETSTTKTPRTRVFQHPQVRIEPLDATTLHEARECRVYEGDRATAKLKRCGKRCWGVYPADLAVPSEFGASALEAVTAWMSSRD